MGKVIILGILLVLAYVMYSRCESHRKAPTPPPQVQFSSEEIENAFYSDTNAVDSVER